MSIDWRIRYNARKAEKECVQCGVKLTSAEIERGLRCSKCAKRRGFYHRYRNLVSDPLVKVKP